MVSLKEHLIIAFNAYKRNFVTLLTSIIIILSVFLIFAIPASFLIASEIEKFSSPESFQYTSSSFQALFLFSSMGIAFTLLTLGLLIIIFLTSGFVGLCYYGVKKRVYLNTFLEVTKKRGASYFLATMLIFLIFLIILLPFIIFLITLQFSEFTIQSILRAIVFLILPFFVLYGPAIISDKGIMSSIKQSINLGRKNYFNLLALVSIFIIASLVDQIPIWIISLVGTLLNYFLIFPLFQITLCSFYIDKTKKVVTEKRKTRKKKRRRK
jgi:glucan phosphoethanolaminetransferase (alkaline phosphatase superfamily)